MERQSKMTRDLFGRKAGKEIFIGFNSAEQIICMLVWCPFLTSLLFDFLKFELTSFLCYALSKFRLLYLKW